MSCTLTFRWRSAWSHSYTENIGFSIGEGKYIEYSNTISTNTCKLIPVIFFNFVITKSAMDKAIKISHICSKRSHKNKARTLECQTLRYFLISELLLEFFVQVERVIKIANQNANDFAHFPQRHFFWTLKERDILLCPFVSSGLQDLRNQTKW